MADQKLSALSAIPTSDINNNTLLYVVDTVGTDTSYQVTRSALYLAISNTWTAQQTLTVINSTAFVINIATGPTGGSTKFIGALSVVANTVAFATAAQTGDYVTNEIGQATLTNPTAGTITNASSLVIDGAPTASTNVTITNTRSLWVKGGISEFDGNIVMSSGNIVMQQNLIQNVQSITTSDYTISEVNAIIESGLLFQRSSANSSTNVTIAPNGTSTQAFIMFSRLGTLSGVNTEFMYIGSDLITTGEFALSSGNSDGTGIIRPFNFYNVATKLMSLDTASTVSLYTTLAHYNNIATAGIGVPAIYGTVGLGVNLNTTATTIASYTPTTIGFFSLRIAISCKTSSTVTLNISYTDPQAGTITNQQIYSKALTGGTTDSLIFNVYASTASAITLSGIDSVALADAYASAQVERLQ